MEIENQAMQLTHADRGRLVHDLIVSFDYPVNDPDEYEHEIQRRVASIKSGSAKGIHVKDVFSLIENKYA